MAVPGSYHPPDVPGGTPAPTPTPTPTPGGGAGGPNDWWARLFGGTANLPDWLKTLITNNAAHGWRAQLHQGATSGSAGGPTQSYFGHAPRTPYATYPQGTYSSGYQMPTEQQIAAMYGGLGGAPGGAGGGGPYAHIAAGEPTPLLDTPDWRKKLTAAPASTEGWTSGLFGSGANGSGGTAAASAGGGLGGTSSGSGLGWFAKFLGG